jgi:hypothetical protein
MGMSYFVLVLAGAITFPIAFLIVAAVVAASGRLLSVLARSAAWLLDVFASRLAAVRPPRRR